MIILSARKCCGDQPSSSSESDRATSQNAKAKHAIRRAFGKLSEMWDFARGGAGSYLVCPLRSNKLSQYAAESERFSEPHNVHFGARRSPETVLQADNLSGFPTAARGSSQGIFVIEPTGALSESPRRFRPMSAQPASFTRSISNAAWSFARSINSILPHGKLPQPSWAPSPLPRSWARVPMATGVPRKTLSLCPDCNREAVDCVIRGESSVADFRDRPRIIEAEIVEEAGRILMRKACEKHGPFEDVLSNHPEFFKRVESLGFGKDFNCVGDEMVHNHGANSIRTGRGTYLIVDLTNRCNMFCSPCYMDANAASYVHELDMQDVTALFETATSLKPQREINVLFSGGEATLSPIFLDAVRHAKSKGFHRLHVTTPPMEFALPKRRILLSRQRRLDSMPYISSSMALPKGRTVIAGSVTTWR